VVSGTTLISLAAEPGFGVIYWILFPSLLAAQLAYQP